MAPSELGEPLDFGYNQGLRVIRNKYCALAISFSPLARPHYVCRLALGNADVWTTSNMHAIAIFISPPMGLLPCFCRCPASG